MSWRNYYPCLSYFATTVRLWIQGRDADDLPPHYEGARGAARRGPAAPAASTRFSIPAPRTARAAHASAAASSRALAPTLLALPATLPRASSAPPANMAAAHTRRTAPRTAGLAALAPTTAPPARSRAARAPARAGAVPLARRSACRATNLRARIVSALRSTRVMPARPPPSASVRTCRRSPAWVAACIIPRTARPWHPRLQGT